MIITYDRDNFWMLNWLDEFMIGHHGFICGGCFKIMHDDKFFEHLHLKRLVTDNNIPYPMSTFERTLRYAKYGYFPCKETKMKIIKAIRELDGGQVELSESLYDGMD